MSAGGGKSRSTAGARRTKPAEAEGSFDSGGRLRAFDERAMKTYLMVRYEQNKNIRNSPNNSRHFVGKRSHGYMIWWQRNPQGRGSIDQRGHTHQRIGASSRAYAG